VWGRVLDASLAGRISLTIDGCIIERRWTTTGRQTTSCLLPPSVCWYLLARHSDLLAAPSHQRSTYRVVYTRSSSLFACSPGSAVCLTYKHSAHQILRMRTVASQHLRLGHSIKQRLYGPRLTPWCRPCSLTAANKRNFNRLQCFYAAPDEL